MNIFITNFHGRATRFGVGTYIEMLTTAFKHIPDYNIFIIHLNTADSYSNDRSLSNVRNIYVRTVEMPIQDDEYYIGESLARSICRIIYPYFDNKSANIVHLNSLLEVNLAKLVNLYPKCSVVYTMHVLLWEAYYKNDYKSFKSEWINPDINAEKLAMQLEQAMCKIADKVICINENAKRFIVDNYGIDDSKIHLIYHFVYVSRKKSLRNGNKKHLGSICKNEDAFTIIYSGRLTYVKGLDFLIEALERLHLIDVNFSLIIAGEGDINYYKKKCENFISKVSFTGFLSKPLLFRKYRKADIGVFVSLTEQFGFSLFEMMSVGLPVLVSDNDSFSYLKNYQNTVVFVPMRTEWQIDVIALEGEILKLMTNDDYRCNIGNNARMFVEQKFSLLDFINSMRQVYLG